MFGKKNAKSIVFLTVLLGLLLADSLKANESNAIINSKPNYYGGDIIAHQDGSATFTLENVWAFVYENNPQILAERAQLRSVDEGVAQAVASWRPTVTLNGSQGIAHDASKINCSTPICPSLFLDSSANLSPRTYGLTINQTVYAGSIIPQTDRAINQVRSERGHLADVESGVLLTVASDYLGVLTAMRLVEINEQYLHRLDGQIDLTIGRVKSGELTGTDVLESKTYRAQASAGVYAAKASLVSARAAYRHDVGEEPEHLAFPKPLASFPKSLEEALDEAIGLNPAIIQSEYALAAAKDNVSAVSSQLQPTLSLQAGIQRGFEVGQQRTTTDSEQVVLQLSAPIYEGGIVYSQSRAANDLVTQLTQQLDDSKRSVMQAVRQAWASADAASKTVRAQESEIAIAKSTLIGMQREALIGTRGIFDILNLEQILFQAYVSLANAEQDKILSQITVLKNIGWLNPDRLSLPVSSYVPQEHLARVKYLWFGQD